LCGCETWYCGIRAEHRIRLFESRVLRLICGFKKEEAEDKIVPAHAMEAYGGGGVEAYSTYS